MRPVFVNVFRDIVEKVSDKLTPQLQTYDSLITGVHYEHGHPLEIVETLTQKDKSNTHRFKKYPLVALLQDFPEHNNRNGFDEIEPVFRVLIIRATKPTFKAAERYDYNFVPVLYPIYEELLKQIDKSPVFLTYGVTTISHTKIDHPYWGRDGLWGKEGNIFNDWVDCVEIQNLKLKTKPTC